MSRTPGDVAPISSPAGVRTPGLSPLPDVSAGGEPVDRLANVVFATGTLASVLGVVASLAVESIRGADRASLTLVERKRLRTAASTHEEALALDEEQYALGEGPCVTAARDGTLASFDPVRDGQRWPRFEAVACRRGVGGLLAVPLVADGEPVGSLNLYAVAPRRFDDGALRAGPDFARKESVAVFVTNAEAYFSADERAEQLLEALETRDTIGQAKGIIMATQRCSPDEAFDILRRASQRENRKLRDLAHDIVERTQRRSEGSHPHPHPY